MSTLGSIKRAVETLTEDRFKRRRALIADNDEIITTALTEAFSNSPIDIVIARNGQEAVDFFREAFKNPNDRFDVTIMDYKMEKLNGIMATDEIRAIDPHAEIIMFTGTSDPEFYNRATSKGVYRIYSKMMPIKELIQEIKVRINSKYRRRADD